MSLLDKLKAAGSVKATTLEDSLMFQVKEFVPTRIPIINVALSGKIDGGLSNGLTVLAGPSKHFKSQLGLVMVQAYMKQHKDSVCLFYDSEFGVTPEYLTSHGIDTSRMLHIPVEHIEQLKFDLSKRLDEIKRGDKVIVFIDSVGNLASKKEVDDALDEKAVADMTRAKQLKGLFRIVTPHFTLKDIPCIVIGHTYDTQEMFSKQVLSGGKGLYYSANQIFMIGRSQDKGSDGIEGYNFSLNVDKSRFVKEKSKLEFNVNFDSGINKWSGLMDLALESGHVKKPSNGWFTRVDQETGEIEEKKWRKADSDSKAFWMPVLTQQSFQDYVKNKYQLCIGAMMQFDDSED